jgi:hypothetical protein
MRVLRYMGGTAAPKRAARVSNRKLSLFSVVELADDVVDVPRTPEERSLNAKPSPSTRSTPRHWYLRIREKALAQV